MDLKYDYLLHCQEDTSYRIKRLSERFQKVPLDSRTKNYCKIVLVTLDDYWKRFRDGHMELLKNTPQNIIKSLDYMKEDQYSITEEIYLECRAELVDTIDDDRHTVNKQEAERVKKGHPDRCYGNCDPLHPMDIVDMNVNGGLLTAENVTQLELVVPPVCNEEDFRENVQASAASEEAPEVVHVFPTREVEVEAELPKEWSYTQDEKYCAEEFREETTQLDGSVLVGLSVNVKKLQKRRNKKSNRFKRVKLVPEDKFCYGPMVDRKDRYEYAKKVRFKRFVARRGYGLGASSKTICNKPLQ